MRRPPTGTPDDAALLSMRSANRRPTALFSGTVDAESPYPISSSLPCRQTEASGYPELFAFLGGQVPNLRGRVTWGDATPGQTLEASLPNIRGSFVYAPSMHDWNIIGREDGAFSFEGSLPSDKWSSLDYQDQPRSPYRLSFSAERSSPIYKDGAQTVQPPAYTVRYLIRARP